MFPPIYFLHIKRACHNKVSKRHTYPNVTGSSKVCIQLICYMFSINEGSIVIQDRISKQETGNRKQETGKRKEVEEYKNV